MMLVWLFMILETWKIKPMQRLSIGIRASRNQTTQQFMILIITQDSKASRLKSGFFAMVYKNTWRYIVELESSQGFGNQKQQGQQLVVYREFASSLEVKAETNKVV